MRVLWFPVLFSVLFLVFPAFTDELKPTGLMMNRIRRSLQHRTVHITYKGKTERVSTPRPLQPAKGQYICGDRLCKLPPGVVPENCNGVCQYPI